MKRRPLNGLSSGSANGNGRRGRWRVRKNFFPFFGNPPMYRAQNSLVTRILLAAVIGLGLWSALAISSVIGTAAAAFAYFDKDLPSARAVVDRQVFQTARLYSRDGELLAELWDQNAGRRTLIPLEDVAPEMIYATLAVEDARFYTNPGFDIEAIGRAFLQNFQGGEVVSGASTLTMQLARNAFFTPEERTQRSYTRKIREIVLSIKLSQQFTKNQILEMYFNEIYYGNLAYGVEAAAQTYFGKSAKDLNLAEATLLAGMPQAPSAYDPFTNWEGAKARQREVISAMVIHGFLEPERAEEVANQEVALKRPEPVFRAPHFVNYVRDYLERRYGRDTLYNGGLEIQTTLDLKVQAAAEKAAREHIATIKHLNANNASVVAIDPKTGEILAMVGSVDFYDKSIDGQVNMAVAERQPGSALKPFNYITAMAEKGVTPATVIPDLPVGFPDEIGRYYTPANHDRTWHGPVTVRRALASSLNMPAVIMLKYIGVQPFLDTLHRAGITSLYGPKYGLSVTLGGAEVNLLDLTYAYAALANNGLQVGADVPLSDRLPHGRVYEPVAIRKIVDSTGKVLYEYNPPAGRQVFSPQHAFLITSILSDHEAQEPTYGPDSFLELTRPAAAKTGTTEFYTDGWTFGYTPDLVAGVWVGNADNAPMKGVMGVSGAGHIWHNFMEDALRDKPKVDFVPPDGVVRLPVWTTDPKYAQWEFRMDWFTIDNPPPSGPGGLPGGFTIKIDRKRIEIPDERYAYTRMLAINEVYPEQVALSPYEMPIKPAELSQKAAEERAKRRLQPVPYIGSAPLLTAPRLETPPQ